MEEGAHAIIYQDPMNRVAAPTRPPCLPRVRRAVLVVATPLCDMSRIGPAANVVVGTSHHVVGKDELVLGLTCFEGGLEPIELSLPEGPVPSVPGAGVGILTASCVADERLGCGVPKGIEHDEEGIAPSPSVIILMELVSTQGRVSIEITCVERVRDRVQVVLLLGIGPHDRLARRGIACVVEMPSLLLLMVARRQEDGGRMRHQIEELSLVEVGVLSGVDCGHVVHRKGISQVDQEVGSVHSDVVQGLSPRSGVAKHDVHM